MNDDPRERSSEHPDEPLDMDAEFAKIVEAYGDQPPAQAFDDPLPPADSLADRFRAHGWSDPLVDPTPETGRRGAERDPLDAEASWFDEGHFVPPEPPPVTVPRGPRLAAWSGVFGGPLLMLALVLFQLSPPSWITFLLVTAFVGGFVYLVATMRRDEDRWPGDDGAVL